MLCLEGQQAVLSWITVLKKREHYHRQFFQHSIEQIAALSDTDLAEKVQDIGLIRHIGKLTAIRDNALAWQALKKQGINPVEWLWNFVEQHAVNNDVADVRAAAAPTSLRPSLPFSLSIFGIKFDGQMK